MYSELKLNLRCCIQFTDKKTNISCGDGCFTPINNLSKYQTLLEKFGDLISIEVLISISFKIKSINNFNES